MADADVIGDARARADDGRVVGDVIDGDGIYCSRLATAGPFVFLGGTAVDAEGRLAAEAAVEPPYHVSPPAHVVHQARYLFDEFSKVLVGVGSSLDQMLQVEQFTPSKVYADGYIDTRSAYLVRGRPTTAFAATGALLPEGAVICSTGIALRPGGGFGKEIPPPPAAAEGEASPWADLGEAFSEEAPYNDIVLAGPYVFVTGDVTIDWETGDVDPAAKVADWIWVGSEARGEAEVLLSRLQDRLKGIGASLADVVHVTMFVIDIGDLFELDRVWRRFFGDDPPARTVIPVRGVGCPRWEGEKLGHRDRAVKLEHQVRAIRPAFGATREVVTTGAGGLAHEAEAIKAGSLLWISQQYAGDRGGLRSAEDTESQVRFIFDRIGELCRQAGTTPENLVRVRAFVLDPDDGYLVYERLRELMPADPPTVAITAVPGPLLLPGASVFLDAVAYVPDA